MRTYNLDVFQVNIYNVALSFGDLLQHFHVFKFAYLGLSGFFSKSVPF